MSGPAVVEGQPQQRAPTAARFFLMLVVLLASALAFWAVPLSEARVAQDKGAKLLRENRPLEAFELADKQLLRHSDDPHLKELAAAAAEAYVAQLTRQGRAEEGRAWLKRALSQRPYLRAMAHPRAER